MKKTQSLLNRTCLGLLVSMVFSWASPFGIGYQIEGWDAEFSASTNPKRPPNKALGYNKIEFDMSGIQTFYLEEPGFLYGALSAAVNTEANQAAARNKAREEGRVVYSYEYASPPPMNTSKWYRYSYSSGTATGATVLREGINAQNSEGTWVSDTTILVRDSTMKVEYSRFEMDIVTAPQILGGGVYWMPAFVIGFVYVDYYDASSPYLQEGNQKGGEDFGYFSTPMNLIFGWRVPFFPYLTVEGQAGWDFINWGLSAILGLTDYEHGWNLGGKAILGTDWIQLYYGYRYEVEPFYNHEGESGKYYHRSYKSIKDQIGLRLDLYGVFALLFADDEE